MNWHELELPLLKLPDPWFIKHPTVLTICKPEMPENSAPALRRNFVPELYGFSYSKKMADWPLNGD